MDREARRAAVGGVAKSQTRLSDTHTHTHTQDFTRRSGITKVILKAHCACFD